MNPFQWFFGRVAAWRTERSRRRILRRAAAYEAQLDDEMMCAFLTTAWSQLEHGEVVSGTVRHDGTSTTTEISHRDSRNANALPDAGEVANG